MNIPHLSPLVRIYVTLILRWLLILNKQMERLSYLVMAKNFYIDATNHYYSSVIILHVIFIKVLMK